MASLISAFIAPPKPAPPPPPPPPPAPIAAETEVEQKARARRSRRATIATTSRGALKVGDLAPQRKRLLGE
ncbi:MAG: hypothetical protein ISR48_01325 [Alphaproteobacteria bacterium]|nr:hypothetical protein [Alphaproteobacteria bacterium]